MGNHCTGNDGATVDTVPTALDAATFPLHGHRLIEASAGTGKTYTIANLYLRLLLGHGSENSKAVRPLSPNEILVVTFTEAATQELRQRIRARIHLAQLVFSHQKPLPEKDLLLQQLFNETPDHKQATKKLMASERQMDEASIFTIHGFCHRMLNQHAFESGALFNLTLTTDENQLLNQATTDFWRKTFYNIPSHKAEIIYQYWKTPAKLLATVRPWLSRDNLTIITHPLSDFDQRYDSLFEHTDILKKCWSQSQEEIIDLIRSSDVNKQSYKKNLLDKWAQEMLEWAESSKLLPPNNIEKFSTSHLTEKTKKDGIPPAHPFFDQVDTFLSFPTTFEDIFLRGAILGIKERLFELKAQQHTLGFDDLLSQLDAALQHRNNHTLRESIRNDFPIAIIDEFQDTDPLQYRIFKTLYPNEDPNYGLFMIGDPKQAIYAFRGADIFTYINARRITPSRFTLPINWRSTKKMVAACNALFSQSTSPFIYSRDIPFSPTKPAPVADLRQMIIKGETPPAITFWCQENDGKSPINKAKYIDCMTKATTQEIKHLLTLSENNDCFLHDKQRTLEANDIAVLVRTGTQAQLIRTALADIGIPSVYMSERDSVFETQEARDIYRILNACLTPSNERLIRAALATSLFKMNASKLDKLRSNEKEWEQAIEEFNSYHVHWEKQGVLSLLRKLLFDRSITQSLLSTPLGERRLTDIIHIGELLSSAAQTLDSPQALTHWLWQHIQDTHSDPSFQLHLESDQNLVKIITIHKSKGLEYPVVFMPYVCDWKETDTGNGYFFHQAPDNQPTLDLRFQKQSKASENQEESKKQENKERMAEDIRLFYVGVTRAVYRCYMGIAPIRKGNSKKQTTTHLHKTAVGYLLNDTTGIEASKLHQYVSQVWCSDKTLMEIIPPPIPDNTYYQLEQIDPKTLHVRHFDIKIQHNWMVTSYSHLSSSGHHAPIYERPGLEDELSQGATPALTSLEKNVFTFPKGARTGVFLHALFERMDFTQVTQHPPTELIEKALLHEGFDPEWQPALESLVNNVITTPLYPENFCLGDIHNANKYPEMEFHLPMSLVHSEQMNQLITDHDALSQQAGKLSFYSVQGMLKGYIDLIFVHKNKYYVVDYKSNYLGDSLECYQNQALNHAMIEHRYDFQYQLYTLAVHRLLKQRLPNYQYDHHMGGVFYLFLRGMHPQHHSGIFFTRPNKGLIEKMDCLFAGQTHNKELSA